ncbi:sigma-54-dependent transcriptional regulator [Candidatus Zixiibacteriota bacterium]
MNKILIAEDDPEMRELLVSLLSSAGWDVEEAGDGIAAIRAIEERPPQVALLDLMMPGKSGQEVLEEARFLEPDLPIVILSGQGDIDAAVQTMKSGASDFLTKPPDPDHLLLVLDRTVEKKALEQEVSRNRSREKVEFTIVGGEAPAMMEFMENLERVSATGATVLLTGETGTGKELAARAIWSGGSRARKPFIVVNCATLSETLLESDLFGHEKGAFTGAVSTKRGMIEEADGATLFLDEVGELPLSIQAKLLRVMEYGEFQRVGSTTTRRSDVRTITATNRNLEEEVSGGRFRSDLFHRLNVVALHLPPLRDRTDDIPAIVEHHLCRLSTELGRSSQDLSEEVWDRIHGYDWPGNIREVRNVLERALVLAPDGVIRPSDIPAGSEPGDMTGSCVIPLGTPLTEALELYKKWMVGRTLDACDGNQTRAADMLGMHRSSLNRLLKDLELR